MYQALTESQRGYVAGLLDGEGTLVVYKQDRHKWGNKCVAYRALVAIANTHVPALQYLKSLLGGKIVEQGKGRKCYTLTFTVNEVRRWLPEVLSYLVIKQEQASILLEFLNRQEQHGCKPVPAELLEFYERCLVKLQQLKKRRYHFKEEVIVIAKRPCIYCQAELVVTSRSPLKKYCSRSCKNKAGVDRFLARLVNT